jgi:hypothetical protein
MSSGTVALLLGANHDSGTKAAASLNITNRPTVNYIIEAQQNNAELSSKISFHWSIIIWNILFQCIIIISTFLCHFISSNLYMLALQFDLDQMQINSNKHNWFV